MNLLEKTLHYLHEEITDIPAVGKNIHYTNLMALVSILKDGKIKGADYVFATKKSQQPGTSEIATMRNTNVDNYNELSGSVDTVKIALYTDRILSGARSVKKEPIAELPQQSKHELENMERDFVDMFDASMPNFKNIKKDFCRRANSLYPERDKKDVDFVRKWVKEEGLPSDAVGFITVYYKTLARMREQLINREREERFIVDKVKGIPIKPEFMKIELIGLPTEKIDDYYNPDDWSNPTKEGSRQLYHAIADRNIEAIRVLKKSDSKLLIRNKNYYKTIELLTTYKKRAEELIKQNLVN